MTSGSWFEHLNHWTNAIMLNGSNEKALCIKYAQRRGYHFLTAVNSMKKVNGYKIITHKKRLKYNKLLTVSRYQVPMFCIILNKLHKIGWANMNIFKIIYLKPYIVQALGKICAYNYPSLLPSR